MYFHGLPASAMYYRDQRVSALYWRGMKIWQVDAASPPLRDGRLNLIGKAGRFDFLPFATLAKGLLNLVPKAGNFFPPSSLLAKGSLNLIRKAASFQIKSPLATRTLNLHGNAGTFGLVSVAWTPANLTGLLVWHDVTDTSTITASSGKASAWADKSGNANHLSEASVKPNYSSSAQLDGYNVIDCGKEDGTNGFKMQWGSAITTAKAVFLVIGTGTDANKEGGGFVIGSSSIQPPLHRAGGSFGTVFSESIVSSSFGEASWLSRSAFSRRNGFNFLPVTGGFEGQSTWHTMWIINDGGAAASSMNTINEDRGSTGHRGGADYAAIIMLNARPSADDIKRLEGYYRAKFPTTLKLPEIHPYASAAPIVGDTPTNNAVTAHRYGKFNCIANVNDSSFSGMSEFQVYETIGGSNAISGATLSSSVSPSNGSLANLVDGNLSTSHAQWSNIVFDLMLDFGSGNTKAINQIGIAPNKDSTSRSPMLMSWSVSDDGINWTKSWTAKYTGSYSVGTLVKISADS